VADELTSLELSAVASVLTVFLLVMMGWRAIWRSEDARARSFERNFPPKAFDATAIKPRLGRIRQNYAAFAHERWRPARCQSFLAAARRHVASLAFFRRTIRERERNEHQ
jgi:hypothetical protein